MRTYAFILCLILIAEIGAGIAAYILQGALKGEITKNMKAGMQNYKKEGQEGVTTTWDLVQHNLECCGVEGPGDWNSTTVSYGATPDSCEKHKRGCLEVFEDQILSNIGSVGGAAIGIAFVQFIGVFFACCNMLDKNTLKVEKWLASLSVQVEEEEMKEGNKPAEKKENHCSQCGKEFKGERGVLSHQRHPKSKCHVV